MSAELLSGESAGNKLSCGIGTVDELEQLVQGTLAPLRTAEVTAHAESCAVCARELGWLRAEKELFAQRARGVPPSQVWSQVEAQLSARLATQLAQQPARTRWRDRLRSQTLQWVAVGAAAALFGIVAASPLSPLKHGFFARQSAPTQEPPRAAAMVPRFDESDHDDAAVSGGRDEENQTIAATAKVSGAITLVLNTAAADINVRVGPAGEVQLTAADTEARSVKLVDRGKGRLQAEFDSSPHLGTGAVQVTVPVGSSVEISTISGDVSITEIKGDVDLRSTSGDLHVRAARKVNVASTSGDVAIESATGPVTVETTSGDVLLKGNVTAPVKFVSTSGSLDVGDACRSGCQVNARTISGDVSLQASKSSLVARLRTRSGEISGADHLAVEMRRRPGERSEWTVHLGRSEGSVELDSSSGGLNLRPE